MTLVQRPARTGFHKQIPQNGYQMPVLLHRKALEPALPDMPVAFVMLMVPSA